MFVNPIDEKIANAFKTIFAYGFWALLCIGIGAWAGVTYSNSSHSTTIAQSIKMGSFIYKGDVFDLTARKMN
jgi:hypothetical protein